MIFFLVESFKSEVVMVINSAYFYLVLNIFILSTQGYRKGPRKGAKLYGHFFTILAGSPVVHIGYTEDYESLIA